jgi:hypothetical protein
VLRFREKKCADNRQMTETEKRRGKERRGERNAKKEETGEKVRTKARQGK